MAWKAVIIQLDKNRCFRVCRAAKRKPGVLPGDVLAGPPTGW